jgi:hypothetical protein
MDLEPMDTDKPVLKFIYKFLHIPHMLISLKMLTENYSVDETIGKIQSLKSTMVFMLTGAPDFQKF